jgi:hypothetical protein
VKSLTSRGECSINFNEFTLDKGATNPNCLTLSGRKKIKGVADVEDFYEKKRKTRLNKEKPRDRKFRQILNEDGSLLVKRKTRMREENKDGEEVTVKKKKVPRALFQKRKWNSSKKSKGSTPKSSSSSSSSSRPKFTTARSVKKE